MNHAPRRINFMKMTIALLSIFNLSNIGSLKAEEILHIGAIPDQNPEHLNRLYKVLSSELSEQLNVQVRYKPVTNYAAAVTAFRTGNLDLVWFGALTGVQARLQSKGSKVIAQRDIDEKFHSVFIANKSSGIPTIKEGTSEIKVHPWNETPNCLSLSPPGQPGEDCLKLNFSIDSGCFLIVEGIDLRTSKKLVKKTLGLIK